MIDKNKYYMDLPNSNGGAIPSIILCAFTVILHITALVTLSYVATVTTILAGASTVALNIYKMYKTKKNGD